MVAAREAAARRERVNARLEQPRREAVPEVIEAPALAVLKGEPTDGLASLTCIVRTFGAKYNLRQGLC
jgi:hypothetical protein